MATRFLLQNGNNSASNKSSRGLRDLVKCSRTTNPGLESGEQPGSALH